MSSRVEQATHWKKDGATILPKDNTVNVYVTKADPEFRQTDSGNSEYTRITKADTSNVAQRFNRVNQPSGFALSFASTSSEACTVADHADFTLGTSFSMTAWVNTSMTTGGEIFSHFDTTSPFTGFTWSIGAITSGKMSFYIADAVSGAFNNETTTNVANGAWRHLGVTYDGINVRFYVDGSAKDSPAFTTSAGDSSNTVYIGRDSNASPSRYFNGKIDELCVWKGVVLSAAEILTDYNSGSGTVTHPQSGSIVANWRFDENTGTTAADQSAGAHTATLVNTPTWVDGKVSIDTMVEANIWKSEDGTAVNEGGKLTIGNTGIANNGTTTINGHDLIFTIDDVEKARFTSDGNFGIGTSAPAHALDVVGVIKTNLGVKTGDFVATPTAGDVYIKRASNNFGVNYMGDLNYAFAAGSGFGDARIATAGTYKFWVTDNSNIVCGTQAANATTATNGFLYIPTCAGTPTGTPTSYTGKVPMVFDTTGVKLWIYTGGAWKGVVLA